MTDFARTLRDALAAEGHDLTNTEAEVLATVAERTAAAMEQDRRDAAFTAERRADVAAHCDELRSFGLWDGE